MTDRILSQCGRVIAADFRPRNQISLEFTSDVLFQDEGAILVRITYTLDGKSVNWLPPTHFLANLHTGQITQV